MIIEELKTVFIHIPKSAGTSLEDSLIRRYPYLANQQMWNYKLELPAVWLYNYFTDRTILVCNKHARAEDYRKAGYAGYRHVALVRHPLARWESMFGFLKWRKLLSSKITFDEWTENAIWAMKYNDPDGFIDKLEWWKWLKQFPTNLEYQSFMLRQVDFVDRGTKIYRLEDEKGADGGIWKDLDCYQYPSRSLQTPKELKVKANKFITKKIEDYFKEDYDEFGY